MLVGQVRRLLINVIFGVRELQEQPVLDLEQRRELSRVFLKVSGGVILGRG